MKYSPVGVRGSRTIARGVGVGGGSVGTGVTVGAGNVAAGATVDTGAALGPEHATRARARKTIAPPQRITAAGYHSACNTLSIHGGIDVQLELSPTEAEVLEEVLTRALGDLREEIYKTEAADYKAGLKARENAIESVLGRLRTRTPG